MPSMWASWMARLTQSLARMANMCPCALVKGQVDLVLVVVSHCSNTHGNVMAHLFFWYIPRTVGEGVAGKFSLSAGMLFWVLVKGTMYWIWRLNPGIED